MIGNAASIPSYAAVNPSGETTYTWAANTTDPRALEQAGGSGSLAAAWYAYNSFTIDVDFTDGNTHDIELYFLDWDTTARSEQVQIASATTGTVLDTATVSSFHNGVYLEWAISGNVVITITKITGYNAVLSGFFFGPAFTGPASATFVEQDATTEGNWINTYGTQGYDVLGGAASLPSYATVTPSGQSSFTWTTRTTDPRALQQAGGGGRIDAVWYATNSFSIDVNITDGNLHDLELYFLDVNSTARSEQVQITSATTGMVLDTETVSSFHNGVYLEWAISGNVVITFTRLTGDNAVLSGLFFGPTSTTAASATFVDQDATTEGNWINTYGTEGYDVIGNAASIPSYAAVNPSGETTYTWAANTTDPRALEQAGGSQPHRRRLVRLQ